MNQVELIPCKYIDGVASGIMLDGQLHVSEAFIEEAKVADQEGLKKLMTGFSIANLGKSSEFLRMPKWPITLPELPESVPGIVWRYRQP